MNLGVLFVMLVLVATRVSAQSLDPAAIGTAVRAVADVEATLPSTRNGTRPVYVLTSPRSFSGGEGLAFLLQDLKRAIVIGERTAGAANPGRPYPAGDLKKIGPPIKL